MQYMWVCTGMLTLAGGLEPEVDVWCPSLPPSTLFFETGSFIGLEFAD